MCLGKKRNLFFILFTLLLILISCGTKTVLMTVTRPAEVNLKPYPKIALGDFVDVHGRVNPHAQDIQDVFTEQLLNTKRFEVVDRQSLGRIIEEQKLALSGLIDGSSAPQIGRLLGASALIFARINQDNFKQEVKQVSSYKDKKGKLHKRYRRLGQYILSLHLKIVDVQTGKIISSKELKSVQKKETTATDKTPPVIDKEQLYKRCLADLGRQFRRMIAPYQTTVKAKFLVDDKIPATKQAVAMFKANEWQRGLHILQNALNQPGLNNERKAKVYYDLGLAQMYLGQNDQAIKNLTTALQLKPTEKRYQKALKTAKEEKRKAEELKKQL